MVADRDPVTIAPPLRGNEWLATNGCCAPEAPHRNSAVAVGGNTLRKFEEFGVDWIQLRGGRFFDGDPARTEDWFTTGADLIAVADGTVTSTRDGMPDQTPDTKMTGLTKPLDYPGNSVIVQIAPTVWAVYAHVSTRHRRRQTWRACDEGTGHRQARQFRKLRRAASAFPALRRTGPVRFQQRAVRSRILLAGRNGRSRDSSGRTLPKVR